MKIIYWLLIVMCSACTHGKFNVLFIIVDDLKPALGCYGDINAHTPNIDNLAKKSITFTQAFAQQSLCAPSRNSFLTARRPDTLHLYDFYSYWRDAVGNFTTIPEYLKSIGYVTKSIGKVFHPGVSSNGSDDSPYSWSEKPFHPFTNKFKNSAVCPDKNSPHLGRNLICPVQVSKMQNKTLPDLETLTEAKKYLETHNRNKEPFFLAVGFQKPHIPLKFPRKYLKLHPINKFIIKNYRWPKHAPSVAYNPWNDIRKREDVKSLNLKFPWQKIPINFAKKIIQSYYAAVSYIDDLIGQLLNQLSTLNLINNTIILLTSDHGWSLGEHAEWAKYSNFDVALQVPLIISIPSLTYDNLVKSQISEILPKKITNIEYNNKIVNLAGGIQENLSILTNVTIHEVVELVDLFPTLADLLGDSIPTCPLKDNFIIESINTNIPNLCSEGLSLMPLIISTLSCQNNAWKNLAFSQYPRPGIKPSNRPNSDEPRLKDINIMGYTIRTKIFRYIAWVRFDHSLFKPDWEEVIAEELYDHSNDPNEYQNVVDLPQYLHEKKLLKQLLKNGWKSKL